MKQQHGKRTQQCKVVGDEGKVKLCPQSSLYLGCPPTFRVDLCTSYNLNKKNPFKVCPAASFSVSSSQVKSSDTGIKGSMCGWSLTCLPKAPVWKSALANRALEESV